MIIILFIVAEWASVLQCMCQIYKLNSNEIVSNALSAATDDLTIDKNSNCDIVMIFGENCK